MTTEIPKRKAPSDLIEELAEALCDNQPARSIARQCDAPPFACSASDVREYWRVIATAALESGVMRELLKVLQSTFGPNVIDKLDHTSGNSIVVPVYMTMGEIRRARAAIAKATGCGE